MSQRIILVQKDWSAAKAVIDALVDSSDPTFQVEWVGSCSEALERLSGAAAILVNVNVPDGRGIETFERLFRAAPTIPILILVDTDTKQTAKLALASNCTVIRRDGFEFFRSQMKAKAIDRQVLESSLHHAIERQELALGYQPKLILATGEIIGAEAILQWRHPQRGLVPPEQFIAIAEGCGLIVAIGSWVLHEACCQMRAWQLEGVAPRCISLKISALELRASGFVSGVRAVLAETGLEPRYLELEMPRTRQMGDTRLMKDSRSVGNVIEEIRELGALAALADFGTAYSNSNDSKGFQVDTLKIDQSLVSGRARGEDGIDLLGGLMGVGKGRHVRVEAEGVETRDQLKILIQPDRPERGGYGFSWPVPANEFGRLLKRSAGLTHWSDQIALSGEGTEESGKHRLM